MAASKRYCLDLVQSLRVRIELDGLYSFVLRCHNACYLNHSIIGPYIVLSRLIALYRTIFPILQSQSWQQVKSRHIILNLLTSLTEIIKNDEMRGPAPLAILLQFKDSMTHSSWTGDFPRIPVLHHRLK